MNINSDSFDYFVELNDAYKQKHTDSKDIANLVISDVVLIDEAIKILEQSNGKEIDFEVDYALSYNPIFKGFKYLETA